MNNLDRQIKRHYDDRRMRPEGGEEKSRCHVSRLDDEDPAQSLHRRFTSSLRVSLDVPLRALQRRPPLLKAKHFENLETCGYHVRLKVVRISPQRIERVNVGQAILHPVPVYPGLLRKHVGPHVFGLCESRCLHQRQDQAKD